MYTKILVAEDLNCIHQGIRTCLHELQIPEVVQVDYCDDALLKLKRSYIDHNPFQLLITDLSFLPDYREQKYPSGEKLIEASRALDPNLKIIVYTVDDRIQIVRRLLQDIKVNGFVCKGRRGMNELKEAIIRTFKDETYVSPQMASALQPNSSLDIDELDLLILESLAQGLGQGEISKLFKSKQINPNSLSSIEKRLNRLKIVLKSNNTIQLMAVSKDLGLI